MRVKITLSYDGSRYLGFQVQNTTKQTVAQDLYDALKSLHIPGKITSSGRTDKNVHATNQVIHIDLPEFWTDTQKLYELLNHKLPLWIRIKYIKEVSEDFHARYSPKKRSYRYLLSTEKTSPFSSAYITYVPQVNMLRIQESLELFLGEHDFKYFQKSGGGNETTVREIFYAKVYAHKDIYVINIKANGFLRSQIRMMIASLLKYGEGQLSLEKIQEQIDAKHQYSHTLAPAAGLYLTQIHY